MFEDFLDAGCIDVNLTGHRWHSEACDVFWLGRCGLCLPAENLEKGAIFLENEIRLVEDKGEKTCFTTFLTDMIEVTDRISESELDMNMRNPTRYETRALVEKT